MEKSMNYYDVSFERDEVFCANIVKAAKESDIRAHYEAKGYKCISIAPVSEERAMASVKYHPGKPIVEIPEIKEEFELGEELYYTPDLMGEELTFEQLFGMIGELVFVMSDPVGGKPLEQQKAVVARVNSIVEYDGEIEDAVLDFDDGGGEPFFTLDSADFSEKYHGEMRSRAWRIKKTVPAAPNSKLKVLALEKNIVNELLNIGIQTVGELEERILEVEAKFPPDWYDEILQALDSQHPIEEIEKAADVVAVPDFPEPLETVVMPNEYDLARQADELVNNGMKLAQIGVSQMCRGVKMMHDGKLYKQFGFQNFEEYCQSKGFSKKHGTRLVKIAEMLEQENKNGTPVSHFENLGITVLGLLATLEPEQRQELAETVDLETVSKRDLEKEIKVMKAQHKADIEVIHKQHEAELDRQKAGYEANLREQREMLEQAQSKAENYKQRMKAAKEKSESLTGQVIDLERQIEELESAPKDVNVAVPVEVTDQLHELEQTKVALESELQETKKREQEAREEIDRIIEESADVTEELEKLQMEVAELKSKPVPKAVPDGKELFRPRYKAFLQALGELADFTSTQKDSPDYAFMLKKLEDARNMLDDQLKNLKN